MHAWWDAMRSPKREPAETGTRVELRVLGGRVASESGRDLRLMKSARVTSSAFNANKKAYEDFRL